MSFAAQMQSNDDTPDTLSGGVSARTDYTLRALSWRRREPTETFAMRGRVTLLLVEVGLVIRGMSIARYNSGALTAEMPTAQRRGPEGTLDQVLSGSFIDPAGRAAFARKAWEAVKSAFPNAETTPIGVTLLAQPSSTTRTSK